MAWDVEFTDEAKAWYLSLSDTEQKHVEAAIGALEQRGPTLGRPAIDSIKGSRHHNMKELRPAAGNLRALFVFDPRRMAISGTSRWPMTCTTPTCASCAMRG